MKKIIVVILFALILSGLPLTVYANECNHNWYFSSEYKKKDNMSHLCVYKCYYCGATKDVEETHNWDEGNCIRQATVFAPAIIRYECWDCKATKDIMKKYSPDSEYSIKYFDDYDEEEDEYYECFSTVYRNSKSITIYLEAPLKGGLVQVKFGKKTYTKKITNNSKNIKIKIKKQKWGKKFTVKVTYKGIKLYSDWSYVWYAKKLKKGFTKKQAKYTWGKPDDTASASGGWSYWYYDDGSYIGFKSGRVRYWYDAAG